MSQIIITLIAVLAIAKLSLQASLPNDEPLTYSFTNYSPDDGQSIVMISDSNTQKLEKTTFPESVMNSPRIDVSNWPNYAVGHINLTAENGYVNSTIILFQPFFSCRFEIHLENFTAGVNSQHYEYGFGIFRGLDNVTTPPTLCSVFRCASINIRDCNRDIPINTDVVFKNITIVVNITKEHDYLLERSSFTDNMLPFPPSDYEWHEFEEDDFYGVQYVLNTTAKNIHSFSINAIANKTDDGSNGDGDNVDEGAPALAVSTFIMFSIFLINVLI